jgi:putative transposon-encoded protein
MILEKEFEIKKFGAGGAHIVVSKRLIGKKVKIMIIEEKEQELSINDILSKK